MQIKILFESIQYCLKLLIAQQDDENQNLNSQLKDTEEERSRLQRTVGVHQSQIEKYKILSEEANRKSEGLQQQLTAVEKVMQLLISSSLPMDRISDYQIHLSFQRFVLSSSVSMLSSVTIKCTFYFKEI